MTAFLPVHHLTTLDAAPLPPARHRDLCTDCGISRTSAPERCGRACQFINPRYGELEVQAHGRARDAARGDEALFGTYLEMRRARLAVRPAGAPTTCLHDPDDE